MVVLLVTVSLPCLACFSYGLLLLLFLPLLLLLFYNDTLLRSSLLSLSTNALFIHSFTWQLFLSVPILSLSFPSYSRFLPLYSPFLSLCVPLLHTTDSSSILKSQNRARGKGNKRDDDKTIGKPHIAGPASSLVQAESKTVGSVALGVYISYFGSSSSGCCAWVIVAVVLGGFILTQGTRIGTGE